MLDDVVQPLQTDCLNYGKLDHKSGPTSDYAPLFNFPQLDL